MASSNKRSRSPTPDEDEEDQSPPNKKTDLNKETETEADDPNEEDMNEEADQEEEEELEHQEDNANQEVVSRDDEVLLASLALSHMMFQRDLARAEQNQLETATNQDHDDLNSEIGSSVEPEEEKEAELDNIVASACCTIRVPDFDDDDSEQTLGLLRRWKLPAIPPENIVSTCLIEQCSKPIRKQLTEKDVIGRGEQSMRLALAKSQVVKNFFPLLEEGEIPKGKEGVRVSVYGPDGKVYEMKMWGYDEKKKKTHVLTTGWRKFVGDYELKENCDFVTIWMFRHTETRQICFAIDSTRLSFKKQVSKRISKAAFQDSD